MLINLKVAFKKRLRRVEPSQKLRVAIEQLFGAHLLRNKIAINIMQPQPPLLLQTFIKWCFGNRREHAGHRQHNAVILNEPVLVFKNSFIVIIKSDDEAGADIQTSILNSGELCFETITGEILKLFGFLKRR